MERAEKTDRVDDDTYQAPAGAWIAEAALEKWEMLDRHSSTKRRRDRHSSN